MNKQITLFLGFLLIATHSFATPTRVTTDWLAQHSNDAGIVLIDMSDSLQYQRFHIPGAINLPYDALVESNNKVSLSIEQSKLIKILGLLGISQDSYVIVYDDSGGLNAARLLWELNQLDHPKLAIVDGGLVKWIREGRPVAFDEPTLKPVTYTPRTQHQNFTATLKDVAPATRDAKTVILDVRSDEEYLGNPKFPRSGHIPGAKWWEWDKGVDFQNGFTLRSEAQILAELGALGVKDKNQPVIVYCRSGHRAAHSFYTLQQLGFKNVRLYDGSMKEYSQHKDQPLKLGKEP